MKGLFNIPNFLTLVNLFSGCLAVVFLFSYHADYVIWCMLISLVADFFDGMAARAFKLASDIGKELDSLADVVSFGVVPGAVFFYLLYNTAKVNYTAESELQMTLYAGFGFVFTLFAALRLAKFNTDTRQSVDFIGLATPAATIYVVGLLQIYLSNSFELSAFIAQPLFVMLNIAFLSFMMIAELPMFSFKFKSFAWKANQIQFIFLAISIAMLIFLKFVALPLIILIYIALSITKKYLPK
jgi:CDP-diacylglycerol---serine O-phosphatidyltransferase